MHLNRSLLLALVMCFALIWAAPVTAKGKKKNQVAEWNSPEVAILAPHPALYSESGSVLGVTPVDFVRSCAVPSTNGVDAYVFEVPEQYAGLPAKATAVGNPAGVIASDIDMFTFDDACALQAEFAGPGTTQEGETDANTRFVVVVNSSGHLNQMLHLTLVPR